jgi:protein phosphatase
MADGMGGFLGGGLASKAAVRHVSTSLENVPGTKWELARVLVEAGKEVASLADGNPDLDGLGTTMTVVVVDQGTAFWAHAGDSRLYLLRDGVLVQISRDHRFLQDLLDTGDVTPEELPLHPLRNVLDQCVGCPGLAPDHGSFGLQAGDVLMLSSDGLHDSIQHEVIQEMLSSEMSPGSVCDALISAARTAGSTDDASVVIFRFCSEDCNGVES